MSEPLFFEELQRTRAEKMEKLSFDVDQVGSWLSFFKLPLFSNVVSWHRFSDPPQ